MQLPLSPATLVFDLAAQALSSLGVAVPGAVVFSNSVASSLSTTTASPAPAASIATTQTLDAQESDWRDLLTKASLLLLGLSRQEMELDRHERRSQPNALMPVFGELGRPCVTVPCVGGFTQLSQLLPRLVRDQLLPRVLLGPAASTTVAPGAVALPQLPSLPANAPPAAIRSLVDVVLLLRAAAMRVDAIKSRYKVGALVGSRQHDNAGLNFVVDDAALATAVVAAGAADKSLVAFTSPGLSVELATFIQPPATPSLSLLPAQDPKYRALPRRYLARMATLKTVEPGKSTTARFVELCLKLGIHPSLYPLLAAAMLQESETKSRLEDELLAAAAAAPSGATLQFGDVLDPVWALGVPEPLVAALLSATALQPSGAARQAVLTLLGDGCGWLGPDHLSAETTYRVS
jgi:hypothetical protein